MSEVSGRVTALLIDGMDRHGLDVTKCFSGLPITRAGLVNPDSSISWDTLVAILERIERTCAQPEDLETFFIPKAGARTGHPFVEVARALFGPASAYRLMARWGIPRDVSVARATFEKLGRASTGELRGRFTLRIDGHRPGSVPFFRVFAGVIRNLPGLMGLGACEMTYTATSHEAVYEMAIPEASTFTERSKRAMAVIAGASTTLDALDAQASEIRIKNVQLEATIADQKRVEETLRKREAWLSLALEAGRVGIWTWDAVSDHLEWSNGAARLYGIEEEDIPQSLSAYLARVHPDDRDLVSRETQRNLTHGDRIDTEHRIIRGDGSIGWIRSQGKVLRNEQGVAETLMGTVVDVSEQKALEMKLLFADRMVSVGKLAAGVAHELNNPLGYVIANVTLMRKQLAELDDADPEEEESAKSSSKASMTSALDAIDEGSERMRDIMTNLRAFSRPDDQRRNAIDLESILDASIRLVANEVRHRAELITEYGPDVPLVLANESRLGQVFINLLVNAAHAIPESPSSRGIIRIKTQRDSQGNAVASVEDNGVGIGPEVLRRLFEPFFTTKDVGQGMGLGLAVCESIVTSLGGTIRVCSELGRGTTFSIVLPPAHAKPKLVSSSQSSSSSSSAVSTIPPTSSTKPKAPPTTTTATAATTTKTRTSAPPASKNGRISTSAPKSGVAGSSGRILVIDDEPSFRTTLKMLLDSHGFDVTIADTARSGLTLAVEARPGFDVILCDLMMPGMTGMDLHAELERDRPEIARKLVFLTGGAFTPRASKFLDRVDSPHVEKPFDLQHLLATIELAKTRSA
jgi:PAS domain S-box-containing protein